MKKELFAIVILIGLLVGAIGNLTHLSRLTDQMNAHIMSAQNACLELQYEQAEDSLSQALDLWLNADEYTHIFIRHSEIDAATDAYYEALSALQDRDSSAVAMINMVQYHINGILAMERVTPKSVL